MRFRSQSQTTSSSVTSQSLSTGGNSISSSSTATTAAIKQKPRSKFQKRLPVLRTALLISALTLTRVEVTRYIPQAVEQVRRSQYFVYTGYFPQAAAYSPSGKILAVCTPHAEPLHANAFSLTGSNVVLYEAETGKKIRSTYDGSLMFEDVAFSKDEQLLYAHSSSRNLTHVYNIKTGESHQIKEEYGARVSRLNTYNNSVIRIYRDRISMRGLEKAYSQQFPLPKNLEILDNTVTGLMFSKDNRFISWVVHSSDYQKKILRLADMKTGRVFDLLTARGAGISAGKEPMLPIVASPDGKTVYLSGDVKKPSNRDDFSHAIAQVDIESGKIIRSQHQFMGVGVSHIKGGVIFVSNGIQEAVPLSQWDYPIDTLAFTNGNLLAVSPDNRWRLVYGRYGVKREPVKP